jgi:hypothetical protein
MYTLQWLRGLERLGHHVIFVDYLEKEDAVAQQVFAATMKSWWHLEQCALISRASAAPICGLGIDELTRVVGRAAAVIQLGLQGRERVPSCMDAIRPRILIDQDPGFSQLWAAHGRASEIYGAYELFFTVGANVGTSRSRVPDVGIEWRRTWNPVVLEWWPPATTIRNDRFTTVASWGQAYLEFEGRLLGPKAEEIRKFAALPRLVGESLELVFDLDLEAPYCQELRSQGWRIASPDLVASAELYRNYVLESAGEFSCAQGVYVGTRCGWFSDRSACYLAGGRPVVLQGTGFADVLPTGRGLFSVDTVEEAADAIRAVRLDYPAHAKAAREIAVEHFDSDRILRPLLREAGIESPRG